MSNNPRTIKNRLTGHALRNANLRERSLARAQQATPLARALVVLRAGVLGLTRLEFARRSGISRGTLRDLELGVHTPTRRILQQFVDYCRDCGVTGPQLEEVYQLYAGSADGMGALIARLELRAGSPAELAHRAGISPATLWEYRRGNFPLPLEVLHRLCQAVEEDSAAAEVVWLDAERQRFLARGYPQALAEFWALCARAGYAEKHLPALGLGTAALRRLRYLELPAWSDVARAARGLCRSEAELARLEQLWRRGLDEDGQSLPDPFGTQLKQLREQQRLSRREVADLFQVGGKKPARIIQSIEEEGCYSARAYPAGLAALLRCETEERTKLLELWEQRRKQFHRRHRPETRIDLRLARELYGFEHKDMEPVLGYSALEYQRLERGIDPLAETARSRILEAIHRAGQRRVEILLQKRAKCQAARSAWRSPSSVQALVALLAEREGGIIPLTRMLREAGERHIWAGQLRAIAQGTKVPPWPLLQRIGKTCGISDLTLVLRDWRDQYRARLQATSCSGLGTEIRLLIAEVTLTLREFSNRLGVNPSVLVRDLQRMDQEKPLKWHHVQRILDAAGVQPLDRRWQQIHAWWYPLRDEG